MLRFPLYFDFSRLGDIRCFIRSGLSSNTVVALAAVSDLAVRKLG